MSHDWYARQFGDRDQFAVSISLGRDPHPTGDQTVDAAWGGLSVWVRGRCLTRNVSSEGSVSDEVRWSLLGVLQWLTDAGVRLVNEEPFPDAPSSGNVRDGCEWFNATETAPWNLTEEEEDEWFLRRSDWRQHHALRRAAVDAALPNIVIRRLGDFVEVSWDNETWGSSRADLSFTEQRGTELVAASKAASVLHTALKKVTQALADHYKTPETEALAEAASETRTRDDDWRWLIHQATADVINTNDKLGSLRDHLNTHTRNRRKGLYVPHAPETLLLRQARLVSAKDLKALLEAAAMGAGAPMKDPIRRLINPTPASSGRPWREGYQRALDVRDALDWGDEPAPDLRLWLEANNVSVTQRGLSSSIDLIATRSKDNRSSVVTNSLARSLLHREIGQAAALGHILLDMTPVAVDGRWEDWPTAARARAFAAMLLLPDAGVRKMLAGRSRIDASAVKRIMRRFNTGPHATTFHLMNLGFIAEEQRSDILQELAA